MPSPYPTPTTNRNLCARTQLQAHISILRKKITTSRCSTPPPSLTETFVQEFHDPSIQTQNREITAVKYSKQTLVLEDRAPWTRSVQK
jgi:hypothetical protein